MSSETWTSTDACCDGQVGPEEDVTTVECDCGHTCHMDEASEGYKLCGNCADAAFEAEKAYWYPLWLAERKLDKAAAEWEADGRP